MGVHFLLSKSLAPTYCRLVKVNLTITALAKNFNTAATKNKEKEGRKCQTRWAPSGPSLRFTKLGELHMGPSVYLVTNCLFVCYSWTRRAPSGPSSSHVKLGELPKGPSWSPVKLGELHKGPSSVLSQFVEPFLFVCLFLMLDQGWSLTNKFITTSVLEHPWEIQPLSTCM